MLTRVGIIGLGAAAHNIHLPAYAMARDKIAVVGGCDISEKARKRARREWNLLAVFDNPEEMIAKTKPDIVSIVTPPAQHFEHCRIALGKGCHVFCEKPFMENLEQVDAVVEMADQVKRHIVVNNEFRYMQIHSKAREFIGEPEFGNLQYLFAWHIFRPTFHTEAGWRGQLEKRVCFEFGSHVFDLIRFFFGRSPSKIFAHMPKPVHGTKADLLNIVSVEFPDGRAASFVLDRICKGPERYLDIRLDGDHAAIHTSIGGELKWQMGFHTKEKRPFIDFSLVKGGKAELQVGNRAKIIAKDPLNPFQTATGVLFSKFLDAIENGLIPPCNANDSRETLALVLAAYESASTGLPVSLEKGIEE